MTTDTITLTYPINVDGIETDTLHMRRPIVRDIKAISRIKDATESTIHLLSSLCTVPPEATCKTLLYSVKK